MGIFHPGKIEGSTGPRLTRKPGFLRRRWRRRSPWLSRAMGWCRRRSGAFSRQRPFRASGGYILLDGIIALLIAAVGFGAALAAVSKCVESSVKFQREAEHVIVNGNEIYRWPEREE